MGGRTQPAYCKLSEKVVGVSPVGRSQRGVTRMREEKNVMEHREVLF